MSDSLRQTFDFPLFWEYKFVLLQGLAFNGYVFACSAVLALAAGLAGALLRVNRRTPFRWIGTIYVEIFRNAPEYILLVWIHFVFPLLLGVLIGRRIEFHPFVSAVLALGFVYSGYFAETIRAGIQSIPIGHIEAGKACGMSDNIILWRVILPQVVRRMLPEALNQFISLLKATTIVSLIAVPDLMYRVSMITATEMRPLPLYTGAALMYFVLVYAISLAVRALSERWRQKIHA